MKITVKKLPKSEVEIEGELEADLFESYFGKALKKIGANVELDGFRKGKVPESVLLSKIPEISILEEMAEMALSEHYPKIVEDEMIDAISRPEISITKLARKNPLGFKIKTSVLPEIKLPKYKELAKKVLGAVTEEDLPAGRQGKNIEVTEADLESTIMDIRKSRAQKKHIAEVEPHEHKDLPAGEAGGEPARSEDHSGGEHKHEDLKDEDLPVFDDAFVQALGPFKDVADFKDKLKINIKLEKENAQKEKTRLKIIEDIINGSEMDLPEVLVELELDKILYRMESDITQMGLKFEDYLKHLNKTVEDLRKEFRGDAEKKAKFSLVLNEIAKAEKIVADEEQVAKEVNAILEQYKDADPERARMHAENVLTNEKIFQFLESQ